MAERTRGPGPARPARRVRAPKTRPCRSALLIGAVALAAALAAVATSGASGTAAHATARVTDPASNLPYTFANPLDAINAGRAHEGLAPISVNGLASLTSAEQMFVVINLERLARSLPPFQQMTGSLDFLAQIGANARQDPPLPLAPANTSASAGTLWAGTADPLLADFGWMYEDGCGGVAPQRFVNTDCALTPPRPWGHRLNILQDFTVANAGCVLSVGVAMGHDSVGVVTEGYCGSPGPSDSVFTWTQAQVTIGLLSQPPAVSPVLDSSGATCVAPTGQRGYRFAGSDGGVFAFGNLPFCGSTGNITLDQPVVGMASTPDKGGYWLVAADGGVFAFGDAPFFGSMGGTPLSKPIVGMTAAPFGNGYWLVAADGGVFAFGSALFWGSMGAVALNAPIVGIAVAPFGLGYWLVAGDGGVFAFGGATFFGSIGGTPLTRPIVGMAASPFGSGYWLVAADGGVFAFGSARFYGSTGDIALARPIVAMATAPLGLGYWLVAADGGVFGFGDGAFYGSTGDVALNRPIVGIAG
jgi:hypothetical protein